MEEPLLIGARVSAASLCLVIVIAVIGNAAVCFLVVRVVPFSVTNVFLFNLSLADILMVLFCVPIAIVTDILRNGWVLGPALCKVIPYIQGVSVFLSAFTHVVISCDRFIVVSHPMRPRISRRKALYVVLGVWCFALLAAVPMAVVSKYSAGNKKERINPECREMWTNFDVMFVGNDSFAENSTTFLRPDRTFEFAYTATVMVLQYMLPVAITTGTYTVIVYRLWGRKTPGESDEKRDQRIASSKRKVSRKRRLGGESGWSQDKSKAWPSCDTRFHSLAIFCVFCQVQYLDVEDFVFGIQKYQVVCDALRPFGWIFDASISFNSTLPHS